MVETSTICNFGWKAQEFSLKGVDGKTYTFADVRGKNGTLVIFLSNTCPYVRAVISRIAEEAKALQQIGVGVIGIMSNHGDPRDSFDNMKEFARQNSLSFPLRGRHGRRMWRGPMMRNARQTSSALTPTMSCNTAAGSTPPAAS